VRLKVPLYTTGFAVTQKYQGPVKLRILSHLATSCCKTVLFVEKNTNFPRFFSRFFATKFCPVPRPIIATISAHALKHNLNRLKAAAPNAKVWAVAKANAYGHGLLRATRTLDGADGFAVLDVADAVRLRDAGVRRPILLLEGFFDAQDVVAVADHKLVTVVHGIDQVQMLEGASGSGPIDVYLKMNTGMNRLGLLPNEFASAYRRLRACARVGQIGFMTHFAEADGELGVDWQLEAFARGIKGLPGPRSTANTAAILRYPQSHFDWVRPGIGLYGCSPFADQDAAALGLRPVMTLSSTILAVQVLKRGDRVGYGGTFVADRSMRIGVVACGYGDGYPRHAPTGTPVLVNGVRTTTVGRVSMDMLTIDITAHPTANVGSPVTLWGDGLSADEVATAAGTVGYELLTALAPRVPIVEAV
jgi:alanine racemase